MQTFSYLQRDSSHNRTVVKVATAIGLVCYEALTSVYTFLPPFFGLFFSYLLFFANSKLKFYEVIYIFLYITVYEIDKGFHLFSFIIFFTIYYNFLANEIKKYLYCKWCLASFYVVGGYLGYYLINCIFSFILNESMPPLGYNYIIYILIDTILVGNVFKKRL